MNSLETAVYALLISFVMSVILCPILIPALHRLHFGQTIRDDGPESHLQKQGTPTMGGISFLLAFVVTSLLFVRGNADAMAVVLVTLGYGLIGFLDDFIKVAFKRSLGLRAYQKIILQIGVTALFCAYLIGSGKSTEVYLPFCGGKTWDLGMLFIPFVFVTLIGTVNGVNLTDGLDGLSSGVTLIVAAFFLICAWASGSGVAPVCGAIAGGLMAFLLFNSYPAKVFMGDTGSLALGGFVASVALVLQMPLFILIVGFVYLWESITVILQVGYFKVTKKMYGEGKRLFKMAPFHHHLEKCGWKETRVVMLFYVATAILALLGFIACRGMFI